MKAIEFNEIEPTWFDIEQSTKQKCIENDVEFCNYLGSFVRFQLFDYIRNKALIETVKSINFNDTIGTRAILNKRNFSTKEKELKLVRYDFNQSQKKLFDWLDKTKDPYFFILNPVFEYGAGIDYGGSISERHGYVKVNHTGVQNLNIAVDYFKYNN